MFNKFQFEDIFKAEDINADALKEAKSQFKLITENAKRCLASSDFQRYKASFERAQSRIMDTMIAYHDDFLRSDNPDISIYAMKMSAYIQKVKDLRVLLNQVETEAKRVINTEEDSEKVPRGSKAGNAK